MLAGTMNGTTRGVIARGFRPLLPEDAADVITNRTGARITRYAIGDRGGRGSGWLMESERLDAPEIYTDDGLIDFAASLQRIFS